ncbi:MAG: 2-keto-3-deoxygluconate permease [Bacillota bacterium]|jgi:2-keto-3-deoxygluconate permease|uniref:2-keto-3-deoxygluconate permease n=1 Tax=Thermanaerosceptrum fracticalcis TaxID=1712410 RepID=A0A7G6E6A2_THEFR|nr:2-keto-3-deoxygluconate permease [Thermanaerosceptrum fracticalcis]MBZ4654279.1 kdgT4 [Peptococcaceae bacterium]QNB47606.1 2-keto-3-deoxygluconate permease [Thermanaerosceptrum fracticalcis]
MKIKKTLEKIPGGMMVVPLLMAALLNTFFPKALMIGGFTTALFKNSALALIALFLLCNGAQMRFSAAPKALKKGVILTLTKYAIGVAIGLGVGKLFGPAGILGLTPLAIIAAMTNSNGGLFVALTAEYGDETDVGAISVLSLNDGPFFTMMALGASGLASIPFMAFIAVLVPIAVGMILGNLDEDMREFLAQGERLLIPFFAFALGAGLDLTTVFKAGASGIILGLLTVFLTGFGGYFALKASGEKNGIAGLAEGSTAGNAVGTPAAIAAVDPSYQPLVAAATAQVAAACIISAILCPALVVAMDKYQKKKALAVADA